jgi:hypothetical protein
MKMRRRLSRSFGAGREISDFAGPGGKNSPAVPSAGHPAQLFYTTAKGKMVAQAIDLRTKHRFQEMLALADLR